MCKTYETEQTNITVSELTFQTLSAHKSPD